MEQWKEMFEFIGELLGIIAVVAFAYIGFMAYPYAVELIIYIFKGPDSDQD